MMMLNNKAHQKLPTWKLSPIMALASKIIMVLITNRNKPNVITVIGNEMNCNMGFKTAFNIPKTIATRIADPKLFTDIPGNNHEVK